MAGWASLRSQRRRLDEPYWLSYGALVDAPLADDDVLRRHAALLEVLAERHGLSALALGSDPGELAAAVGDGRTYLDVAAFELEVIDTLGRDVHVTPTGAPGARTREPLAATPAA